MYMYTCMHDSVQYKHNYTCTVHVHTILKKEYNNINAYKQHVIEYTHTCTVVHLYTII